MAEGFYTVHLGVKILALIDLAVFLAWNLAWSMNKTSFVCFGKKHLSIDDDFSEYENYELVDSEENINGTSTGHELVNHSDDPSPIHGMSAMGWTAFGLGFTIALIIVICYIFLEMWLCWTLYRAARDKQKALCTKWLVWRVVLLTLLFIGILSEVACKHCLHIPKLVYALFRILTILAVSEYRRNLQLRDHVQPNYHISKSSDKIRLEADYY